MKNMAIDNILARIKAQVDTLAACRQYDIELQQRGSKFVGLCPFPDHAEKTASFTVFEDGKFKCYGCGKHGDSIDFVRLLFGMDFKSAVAKLAADFGIQGNGGPVERPRKTQAQLMRMQYFGIVDLLLLDRRYLLMQLRQSVAAEAVHALGTIEGLLFDLLHGHTEEQAAALLRARGWLSSGGYWATAGRDHAA